MSQGFFGARKSSYINRIVSPVFKPLMFLWARGLKPGVCECRMHVSAILLGPYVWVTFHLQLEVSLLPLRISNIDYRQWPTANSTLGNLEGGSIGHWVSIADLYHQTRVFLAQIRRLSHYCLFRCFFVIQKRHIDPKLEISWTDTACTDVRL